VRAAVAFLTPFGRARPPGPSTFDWFPLVGAALGLVLGGLWWVAVRAWPYPVAAAVVVAGDLAVTGMLHFDGLVDSADGLLAPMAPERRLTVMADPGVGAFGLAVGGAVLLVRWAALSALRPGILLLAGLWCLSRTTMALIARTFPYVRGEGGLARAFQAGSPATTGGVPGGRGWHPVRLGAGLVAGAALLAGWRVGPGLASGAAALVAAAAVAALARRRIGGFTGDVLGAAGVLAETAGLLVAAARW
jgi:adenosylcobinamide-GDP ribazoletransferase